MMALCAGLTAYALLLTVQTPPSLLTGCLTQDSRVAWWTGTGASRRRTLTLVLTETRLATSLAPPAPRAALSLTVLATPPWVAGASPWSQALPLLSTAKGTRRRASPCLLPVARAALAHSPNSGHLLRFPTRLKSVHPLRTCGRDPQGPAGLEFFHSHGLEEGRVHLLGLHHLSRAGIRPRGLGSTGVACRGQQVQQKQHIYIIACLL